MAWVLGDGLWHITSTEEDDIQAPATAQFRAHLHDGAKETFVWSAPLNIAGAWTEADQSDVVSDVIDAVNA